MAVNGKQMTYDEWKASLAEAGWQQTFCASLSEEQREEVAAEAEELMLKEYEKAMADPDYKFTGYQIINKEWQRRMQEIIDNDNNSV